MNLRSVSRYTIIDRTSDSHFPNSYIATLTLVTMSLADAITV